MSFRKTIDTASHTSRENGRLDFLDGLRGVAMLMVLLFHSWTFGGQWHANLDVRGHAFNVCSIFGIGHVGVGLFLVLSGFCLYWPFVKPDARREPTLKEFALRRCRRILPPYYVALAFSVIWLILTTPHTRPEMDTLSSSVGWHLLMVHNLRPAYFYDINGSFWSLGLEFQLYILFPLLVEAFRRYKPEQVLWILAIGCTLFRAVAVLYGGTAENVWENILTYSIFGRCLEFALGMAAASVVAGQSRGERFTFRYVHMAILVGLLVLAAAGQRHGSVEIAKSALSGCVFTALLLGASRKGSALNHFFSSRPLVRLGIFSYSVYLVHHPLVTFLGQYAADRHLSNGWSAAFQLGFVVPLALSLGYLFHLAFERPFMSTPRRSRDAVASRTCLAPMRAASLVN